VLRLICEIKISFNSQNRSFREVLHVRACYIAGETETEFRFRNHIIQIVLNAIHHSLEDASVLCKSFSLLSPP
jgi:hypothetical protein